MRWLAAFVFALATPVAARDLPVPPSKGWRHAEPGLVLMPQLTGMSRTALTDATQTEHDVAAQYDTTDKSAFATIYLFHPAIADVSLWFDRSQTALETRDTFANASPATTSRAKPRVLKYGLRQKDKGRFMFDKLYVDGVAISRIWPVTAL